MILGNPWGLLGLLAVPAILAIHLYRRRYRPRPVTALFLYGPRSQTVAAGRMRQQLVWRRSLWLELAASLAATWFLVDPHLADRHTAVHLVLILDTHRSLQAEVEPGISVHRRLRDDAARMLAALSRDDRVTLVAGSTPPRLLAGPAAPVASAIAALDGWRVDDGWHDLEPAVALASGLAGEGARLVLLSDRADRPLGPRVGLHARGRALPTSGLVDVRWNREPEGERILARILAQGGAPRSRQVVLRGRDGTVFAQRQLDLLPGKPQTVVFIPPPLPETAPGAEPVACEVVLTGPDPLACDDQAVVVRPPRRVLRVGVALAGADAEPLAKALAVLPDLVVDQPRPGLPAAPVHLRFASGDEPPPVGTWQARLVAGQAKPVLGPFLSRQGHPLLAEVDFTGVVWAGGAVAPPGDAEVLLAAGGSVLISEKRRGRDRLITLHCDLAASSLRKHPAWPSLIANLVASRRAALPGPARANLLVGQPALIVLPHGASRLHVIDPLGATASFEGDANGSVLLPGLRLPGLHQLRLPAAAEPAAEPRPALDTGAPAAWSALNGIALDARLADLSPAQSLERPVEAGRSTVERDRSAIAHLLPIVLAALCALGAWTAFAREEAR